MREKRPEALRDADIALHRQQVEVDRKDVDQEIGEDKDRHRKAKHGEYHDEPVDP